MATYYIKTNGNDADTGLSPSNAWQTIQKGVGAAGITGGDTLYIAPGDYRNTSSTTIMAGIYSTTVTIIGDVTASQFSGNNAGRVLITNRGTSDFSSSSFSGTLFSTGGKSNITFQTLLFENASTNATILNIADSSNLTFDRCIFYGSSSQQNTALAATGTSALYTRNHLFTRCIFYGNSNNYSEGNHTSAVGVTYDYNLTLDRCLNLGVSFSGSLITASGRGFYMVNCTNCFMSLSNTKGFIVAKNCNYLWSGPSGSIFLLQQGSGSSATGNTVERCAYTTTNTYTHTAINNIALPGPIQSMSENRLWGLSPNYERSGFGVSLNNQGTLYGTVGIPTLIGRAGYSTMGVPLTDLYGNPWDGNGNPHIGAFNDYSLSSISRYIPTDRTRTFLQIESGSTSNSIEMYLGAIGLTAASIGLSAYYNRTRSNPVQITLIDTSITSSWASGGFAEVDSSLMPGIYRVDVPNEAFAVGANDVTILVRGLSGSNGAFVNCQLMPTLTNASIAQTVWTNTSRTITGGIADTVTTITNRAGFAITGGTITGGIADTVTTLTTRSGFAITGGIADTVTTLTTRTGFAITSNSDKNGYTITAGIVTSVPTTETSYVGIATSVWQFANRTITGGIANTVTTITNRSGFAVTNISQIQSGLSTLTINDIGSAIGNSLTYSGIANSVWNYATRTLSSIGISAFDVWNYYERTLSSGSGISAYDVWNHTDRTITGGTGVSITQTFPENFEFMLITNTGRIYLSKPDIRRLTT